MCLTTSSLRVGSCQTVAGSCQTVTGSCQTVTGSCQTVTGSCQTVTGSCQTVTGSCQTVSGNGQTLSDNFQLEGWKLSDSKWKLSDSKWKLSDTVWQLPVRGLDVPYFFIILTGWTGTFAKTSSNAYNSKTTQYMIILMTILEKLEKFAYTTNTLIKKISSNQVFFPS